MSNLQTQNISSADRTDLLAEIDGMLAQAHAGEVDFVMMDQEQARQEEERREIEAVLGRIGPDIH